MNCLKFKPKSSLNVSGCALRAFRCSSTAWQRQSCAGWVGSRRQNHETTAAEPLWTAMAKIKAGQTRDNQIKAEYLSHDVCLSKMRPDPWAPRAILSETRSSQCLQGKHRWASGTCASIMHASSHLVHASMPVCQFALGQCQYATSHLVNASSHLVDATS